MRHVVHLAKAWLIPGSMPMLLMSVLVCAVLLNLGGPAALAGRVVLTVVAAAYCCLSLPVVSGWLIDRIGEKHRRLESAPAGGRAAMVVFGNGSVHYTDGSCAVDYLTRRSVFCAFEAARVYRIVAPDVVIAAGGNAGPAGAAPESELLASLLAACGVPRNRIVLESASRNTAAQVTNVLAQLAALAPGSTIIAVTTSAHVDRVVALFERHGVRAIAAPTPELRYDAGLTGWRRWLPSMAALTGSASVMYEWMARLADARPSVSSATRQNNV
jgi:uncharacterized SAM-binding protein YcdF (DUF218 family)